MFEEYTFHQFMVKPSLMKEYLINKNQDEIKLLFLNYLDHISNLCGDEPKKISEIMDNNKKVQKLLKIILIMNESYSPTYLDLKFYNSELMKGYLMAAQKSQKLNPSYYRLLLSAILINMILQLITVSDISDRINSYINIKDLLAEIQSTDQKALALLNLQLLIELSLMQEQFTIENLFIIHDAIQSTQTHPGYSRDKIEDYREIVLSIQDELSPVTDAEDDQQMDPIHIEKEFGISNTYFTQDLLNGVTGPRIICIYLQNAISQNNRDLIIGLQRVLACKGQDLVIDKLITIYLDKGPNQSFTQIEQLIYLLDISKLFDLSIINVITCVILSKTESIRLINQKQSMVNISKKQQSKSTSFPEKQDSWKDTKKVLVQLINKFNKPIQDNIKGYVEFVDTLVKSQINMIYKIDQYVAGIQLAFYLILSDLIHTFQLLTQDLSSITQIKILLDSLVQLFDKIANEDQWDLVNQFIDNCLSKTILECLQGLLIKSISQIDAHEFQQYYPMLGLIMKEFSWFEIRGQQLLKKQLALNCFKREKQVMVQTFDSLELRDQLQFRYSKLYKKQGIYHHKIQNYQKSLRHNIKYFQVNLKYILGLSILDDIYCLKIYRGIIDFDLYAYEFQEYERYFIIIKLLATIHTIITSQFISITLENTLFENMDINEELAQFIFDGRMIERICSLNQKNQKLAKLMIARIQDQDCYLFKSQQHMAQVQEKYLNKYLRYLSEQLIR